MNPIPAIRKKSLAIIYSPSLINGYYCMKFGAPFSVKHFLVVLDNYIFQLPNDIRPPPQCQRFAVAQAEPVLSAVQGACVTPAFSSPQLTRRPAASTIHRCALRPPGVNTFSAFSSAFSFPAPPDSSIKWPGENPSVSSSATPSMLLPRFSRFSCQVSPPAAP